MNKRLPKLILFLTILFISPLLIETTAQVVMKVEAVVEIENPLEAKTLSEFLEQIATFIFNLALWLAPVMYIIAAFYWITATGREERIEIAKKMILYTTIGLIIALSAMGLITLFKEIFLKKAGAV